MSSQIAGLAPATRVVSRKLGPTSGRRSDSSASVGRGLLDQHVRDHVRHVADRRHQPVVRLGVDRLRAGPQVGDRALQQVVLQAARALGRGQVPASALEEVGPGVLDARGLGARQRVTADEPLLRRRPRGAPRGAPRFVEPTSVMTASASARAHRLVDQRRGARRRAPRRRSPPRRRRPPRRTRPRRRAPPPRARARGSPAPGSNPATSAPMRRRAARPTEPPIRPTPRTAMRTASA